MKSKFKTFINSLIEPIKLNEMRILPGQLAFFFVMSIVPLIAVIGSIAASLNIDVDTLLEFTASPIPEEVISILEQILSGKSVNINIFVFYISAFILASNGPNSMIIASNTIYKLKSKDYLSRRIKAFIMTIILIMLLLFVIVVPTFGDFIIEGICSLINNNRIEYNITVIYSILKYPISLLLIYFNIKLLYVMAPDSRIASKYTSYGSMFTTFGWIIASEIYSIYTSHFSNYNLYYGSISSLLILLLWIYILAYIFVLGMALNATYYKDKE